MATFTDALTFVDSTQLPLVGQDALASLAGRGFRVSIGIREQDAAELAKLSRQPGIQEFCPNDEQVRFGTKALLTKWLSEKDSRRMFILRSNNAIAGYGWTGNEVYDTVPGSKTGFALRINADFGGNGLAVPFTTVILATSMALFTADNIALETWASNTGAVRTYLSAGAALITTKDSQRTTHTNDFDRTDSSGAKWRRDVRLYMKFGWTFKD